MKIIAVIPNPLWLEKEKDTYFPYSLLMINGLINKIYGFEIIDANGEGLSQNELIAKLKKSKPDVLMVSGLSIRDRELYDLAFKLAKQVSLECVTIFGGIYPTILPEDAFDNKNIDILFLGHVEKRLLPLLDEVKEGNINKLGKISGICYRDKNSNSCINSKFENIKELSFSFDPSYKGVNLENYFIDDSPIIMNTSPRIADRTLIMPAVLGCPYNCSFCANKSLSGSSYVYRSLDSILREVDYLVNTYRINFLALGIDCICADKTKFIEIITSIHKRWPDLRWSINPCIWHLDNDLLEKIKECGCVQLALSVECGHQGNLKKLVNKPLNLDTVPGIAAKAKELGIFTCFYFLIGFPGETWQEIRESLAFADSIDGDYIQIKHSHTSS